MPRKWRTFLLVILSILAIGVSFGLIAASIGAQTENAPPYLYYYSHLFNAFVIERADGSDSRLFGAGLMPNQYLHTFGPGWSPSGKWLAWVSATCCYANADYRAWLLNIDGKRRVTALDALPNVDEMKWSPSLDLLAMGGGGYVYLVNPDQNKIIAQMEVDYTPESSSHSFDFQWSVDGRTVSFYYRVVNGTEDNVTVHYVTIDDKGIITTQVLGTITSQTTDPRCYPNAVPPLWQSSTGWQAVPDASRHALRVSNPSTGSQFDLAIGSQYVNDVHWSPKGADAFVSLKPSCDSNASQLMYLSTSQKSLRLVTRNAYFFVGTPYQAAPEIETKVDQDGWSPDGDHALLTTDTGSDVFYLVDLPSLQLTTLHFNAGEPDTEFYGGYAGSKIEWLPGGNQFYLRLETSSYLYDLIAQRVIALPDSPFLELSADGRYLASRGHCNAWEFAICVLDQLTGQKHIILEYSNSDHLELGVVWNPAKDWLISIDGIEMTGGGLLFPMYTVSNADGTIQRELTKQAIVGWMRIDPPQGIGQPTSLIGQSSLMIIAHDKGVNDLSWSPDGKVLASTGEDNALRVWDAQTGAARQTMQWEAVHSQSVSGTYFAWSSDHSRLLTWMNGNQLTLWKTLSGESLAVRYSYNSSDGYTAWAAAFRRDGTPVIMENRADGLYLIDPAALGRNEERAFNSQRVGNLLISPDGKSLATSNPSALWDISTGRVRFYFDDKMTPQTFSPDSTMLVIGDGSQLDFLYASSGQKKMTIQANTLAGWSDDGATLLTDSPNDPPIDHNFTIWHLRGGYTTNIKLDDGSYIVFALSPDGTKLAALNLHADTDSQVNLTVWDTETGQVLNRFYTGGSAIKWSPDSKYVASASGSAIRLWLTSAASAETVF